MSERPRAPASGEAHVPALTDLDRLVETERRLEAAVAEARREAERIVTAAREEACLREQRLERECQEALDAVRADIEAERDREIAEIGADAARRVRAFDTVPAERVAELARYVVDRVIGEPPEGEER